MQIEACKALIEAGLVSAGAIEEATLKSRANKKPLLVNLFEECDADTQRGITETLARFYKIPLLHLDRITPSPNLIRLCKPEHARRWYFLPIAEHGPHVVVGMIDPTDLNNVDMLQRIFRKPIQAVFIYAHDFENGLYRFFRNRGARPVENAQLIDTVQLQHIMRGNTDTSDAEQSQAVIAAKFIRQVLSRALTYGASDLLIEPVNDELLISLRIEGGVYRLFRLSISHHDRVLTALKQMVKLDEGNTGSSQRRSLLLRFDGRAYKLLMHFYVSPAGECATVHIIDPRLTGMALEQLGLSSETENAIKTSLNDSGLVLVTGPCGSGKSTAVMAFLRHLAEGKRRIISLEDLIIEPIPGVKQMQVSPKGPAKSTVLRSLLHHTPDVIVLDEVADEETIAMALQLASSEDCLIILVMEADGIAEAIAHLLRMGIDRSQLAQTLRLAYTQKIVRKICPDCKSAVPIHADTMQRLHIPSTFTFYAGSGCDACKQTGYRGTTTIGEPLRFSPGISEMLEGGASGSELYAQGRYDGMLTLYERALNKAIDGTTSLDEVLGIFTLPQAFSFKDRLHLGRIAHLDKPEATQEKTALDDSLTSLFKAAAKEQAEPPDLSGFPGFEDTEETEKTGEDNTPASPSSDSDGKDQVAETPARVEERSPEPEQQSDKLMVLLLDDSPVMLEYTRHILSSTGVFDVETAGTVEEAWDKLQRQYFHLVITDHEMPEQTGQEFIERIRKQPTLNHTGTMLLTGNVKEASALSGGADGYVAKPTDPELLVARAKSIAEIYKRMSAKAVISADGEAADKTSSKSESAGRVDFTEQNMRQISSFELDTQRFKVAKPPGADSPSD